MVDRDPGDPTPIKARKSRQQLEDERCLEEVRKMLGHRGNRYFIWRLLAYCGMFQTTSGAENPQKLAIHSGMRDAALWVWAEMNKADPEAWFKMQQEAIEREKKLNG